MRVVVDLASFYNAEFMSKDGVAGIFIPMVPNYTYDVKHGIHHAFARFRAYTISGQKGYDMRGIHVIPKEHADRFLENPDYAGRRRGAVWIWNESEPKGGAVSREEFEKIVGG